MLQLFNKYEQSKTKTLSSLGKDATLILIGPDGDIGEDVGELLALRLGKPFVDLWEISEVYAKEIGFRKEDKKQAHEKNGLDGVYHYMIPFVAHSIKRGVEEHKGCVIQFDALQSVIDDSEYLQSIAGKLQPLDVVLLLPTDDDTESVEIMRKRNSAIVNGKEMNEHFLTHHSNYDLANYTFYTKDKTPEQTADEILAQIDADASDIILIGAIGVGKSTVGKILASKLGNPQVSLDKMRWKYYKEKGWSEKRQEEIRERENFHGVYWYWKQNDVHAVKRILQEHKNCVIDFGAGHSIYENSTDFSRVSELLTPYENVVLLMPSPDLDESISILRDRRVATINGVEMCEFLVTHSSSRELADIVVFTQHRTPSEIVNEIFERLN